MVFYQRSVLWLIAVLAFVALAGALIPSQSNASGDEEALALLLVRSGDIENIEQTFEAQYQDFVVGKISVFEFNSPYNVFYTLEPLVLEVVAEWRKAEPNSAHARVAEAGTLVHLAEILRGEDVLRLVPRTSYLKAWQLWTDARTLYSEALDIAPIHLRAATNLDRVAQNLGDKQAEMRGKRIVAVHGLPKSLLLSELRQSAPQWGGSVAKMRRLCDTVAPKVEGISVAECHARATLILWDVPREERDQAIEVLRLEDEEGNRFTIAQALLYSGRAQEALNMYDEVNAEISISLAPEFARVLNNYAIQERIVDRRLAVNPLHPRALAMKSESQGRRGDFAGAAETIEKAMIYGETIPEVRYWRLAAMMQDKSRHHEVLSEIEDALTDTDLHPTIMEFAVSTLVWGHPTTRYAADGSEHSRYQCRLLRILSNAANSCGFHPDRTTTLGCSNSSIMRAHEIIGETDINSCSDLPTLRPVQ